MPAARFVGETNDDLFGAAVRGAGDLDGDRRDDVAIGAWDNGDGGGRARRAYVFAAPSAPGTHPAGTADVIVTGAAGADELGLSLAAAGDVDGNGVGDLIIGAPMFTLVHLNPMLRTSVPMNGGEGRLIAGPNPFPDATEIRLILDQPSAPAIDIFDARGRRVRSMTGGSLDAGLHVVRWDGRDDRGARPAGRGRLLRSLSDGGRSARHDRDPAAVATAAVVVSGPSGLQVPALPAICAISPRHS